jgi:two-component system sensor histidine kinase AlgZ
MVSIRQKAYPDVLPDFRNVGVVARVLIAVNAAVLAGALFAAPNLVQALQRFVSAAALAEPLLLLVVTLLFVLSPLLTRLPYWAGCAAVPARSIESTIGSKAAHSAQISQTLTVAWNAWKI